MAVLPTWPLSGLVFAIALLYASVGAGGGSGYLAVMSWFNMPPVTVSSTALLLNVFVAAISLTIFSRQGHFRSGLIWPFLVGSIPAAVLGGWLPVSSNYYRLLLSLLLLFAAFRTWKIPLKLSIVHTAFHLPKWPLRLAIGGLIGFISGLAGMGGGIFLSPLLILSHWASPKQAATASAVFVLLNSLSGLGGRMLSGVLNSQSIGWGLVPVGILGALAGGMLGAKYLPDRAVRRTLAGVLLIVSIRLLLNWLGTIL